MTLLPDKDGCQAYDFGTTKLPSKEIIINGDRIKINAICCNVEVSEEAVVVRMEYRFPKRRKKKRGE